MKNRKPHTKIFPTEKTTRDESFSMGTDHAINTRHSISSSCSYSISWLSAGRPRVVRLHRRFHFIHLDGSWREQSRPDWQNCNENKLHGGSSNRRIHVRNRPDEFRGASAFPLPVLLLLAVDLPLSRSKKENFDSCLSLTRSSCVCRDWSVETRCRTGPTPREPGPSVVGHGQDRNAVGY